MKEEKSRKPRKTGLFSSCLKKSETLNSESDEDERKVKVTQKMSSENGKEAEGERLLFIIIIMIFHTYKFCKKF